MPQAAKSRATWISGGLKGLRGNNAHAIYKGAGGDAGLERLEVRGGDLPGSGEKRGRGRYGGRELRHLDLCRRHSNKSQ